MRAGSGGFQLPQVRTAASKLAIAVGVVSLLCWTIPGFVGFVALTPDAVFHGFRFWQPLTYSLVATDILGLLFGCLIIWSIGGHLEGLWGPRRMLSFALGVTAIAALLTLGVALVVPRLQLATIAGAWTMTTALWVAYGLSIGKGQAYFWGIPTTGNILALIGAAFVLISFLQGAAQAIPGIFAILLTLAYMRGITPRVVWLRFQSWRLRRQMHARSKHLRVVGGRDANQSTRGSDRFLH